MQTLIGRARELDELLGGLKSAQAGRGEIFLVVGEPGAGKTHLVGEVARRATEAGAKVLWGRCWEGGGAPPYWPWVQILRAYVRDADRESVLRSLGGGARDLAALVPELSEISGAGPPDFASLGAESARFAFFDSVTTFLKNAASSRPLVLLIDDLHAADLPSLLLADFFANEVAESPVLLIGAYREHEAKQHRASAEVLARIVSRGRRLDLTGLDEADVNRYIEVTTGRSATDSVAQAVFRTTEGNPLFMREVARLLAAHGRLESVDAGTIPIPESVRETIRLRLAPLQAETRTVLEHASVIGREFDFAMLARASDTPPERLLDALSPAVVAGIVGDIPGTLGRYSFSHALIRETLYDDLSPAVRQRLHLHVAHSLEDLYGPDRPRLPELAFHFFQAAVGGDLDKAIEYGVRAADRALEMLAYEDAAILYERSAHALRLREPGDEERRCALLIRAADAQSRAGNVAAAREGFLAVAELARRLGRPEDMARAALGLGLEFTSYTLDDGHVSVLEVALERLDARDDPLRARVMGQLGGVLYFSADFERSAILTAEAVAMARRLGDPSALASALCDRHQAVWSPDNAEERLAMATEIVDLAQTTGDRELMLQGLGWRVTDRLDLGDVAGADVDVDAYERGAKSLRQPRYLWRSFLNRAVRAGMNARFEDAERLLREALETGQRAGDQAFLINYVGALGMNLSIQGRLGEVGGTFEVENAPAFSEATRAPMALARALGGDLDGARRDFERFAAAGFTQLRRDHAWLSMVCALADLCRLLGDEERAGVLAEMLVPHARRFVTTGRYVTGFVGPVRRFLAPLFALTQRWDEAEEAWAEAVGAVKRMGCSPILAQIEAEHARALVMGGRTEDHEHAAGLLSSAIETARQVGMTPFVEATVRDAIDWGFSPAEIGAEAPPQAEPEARRWVLRKEGDYWSVGREGAVFRLKDLKGLRYLAALLAQPGLEFHALDLAAPATTGATASRRRAAAETRGSGGDLSASGWGDAGAALDAEAKAAYKRRLDDLREQIEEAESWGDAERASRAREEIEQLAEELARGVGLGGRDRRAASAAERARVSVTKAIGAAIDKISEQDSVVGRHLASAVRTGAFCSYSPDPAAPVSWRL